VTTSTGANNSSGTTDITEIGQELWAYLTGKGATVEYSFDDMSVEVPRTTGPDAQRATWKINGTLRIRTTDKDSAGSIGRG
jgi:hypothetical protein